MSSNWIALPKRTLLLFVDDTSVRQMRIRTFRKKIYADHFDKDYLEYISPMPVPLSNLEADTYEIYVMYMNEYYGTGEIFTIS